MMLSRACLSNFCGLLVSTTPCSQALDLPRRSGVALTQTSLRAGSIAGIDNDRKEDYLLDEEFPSALGNMTRAQFAALPEWRRIALKKAAGLF